jgi:hypothetical protein
MLGRRLYRWLVRPLRIIVSIVQSRLVLPKLEALGARERCLFLGRIERTGSIDGLGHDCLATSIIKVLGDTRSHCALVVESFVTLVNTCKSRAHDGACRKGCESGLHIDNAFVCSWSREVLEMVAVVLDINERPLNE